VVDIRLSILIKASDVDRLIVWFDGVWAVRARLQNCDSGFVCPWLRCLIPSGTNYFFDAQQPTVEPPQWSHAVQWGITWGVSPETPLPRKGYGITKKLMIIIKNLGWSKSRVCGLQRPGHFLLFVEASNVCSCLLMKQNCQLMRAFQQLFLNSLWLYYSPLFKTHSRFSNCEVPIQLTRL